MDGHHRSSGARRAGASFFLFLAGCYSPNDNASNGMASADDESSDGGTAPTGSATTVPDTTPTDDGSPTTTPSDTSSPTDASADPSADPSTDPGSTTDGPANPFCGDGNIDAGEDCDDGEDNALTAACRPDCTPASCGDGDIWAGVEGCDDGEGDNVLEIGACAPDCSQVIEEKAINAGGVLDTDGDFGNNPVAFADSTCDPGELAMFAYPNVREAALDPLDPSGALDWVLKPYTAYTNHLGDLVWITDSVPLLGVRDGEQEPLLVPIYPCAGAGCMGYRKATGLTDGWLTRTTYTCSLWSENSTGDARVGAAQEVDDFLDSGELRPCDDLRLVSVYCVEQ